MTARYSPQNDAVKENVSSSCQLASCEGCPAGPNPGPRSPRKTCDHGHYRPPTHSLAPCCPYCHAPQVTQAYVVPGPRGLITGPVLPNGSRYHPMTPDRAPDEQAVTDRRPRCAQCGRSAASCTPGLVLISLCVADYGFVTPTGGKVVCGAYVCDPCRPAHAQRMERQP